MTSREALQLWADKITAEGVPATTDVRAVYPPCILMDLPEDEVPTNCGSQLTGSLWAIVPGPFSVTAWDALDLLVETVQAVLPDHWQNVYRKRSYVIDGQDYPAAEIVYARYPI